MQVCNETTILQIFIFRISRPHVQDAKMAEERAAKAENKLQEANEQSQYELRNQIHDLEIQLRDKETFYQGLQEEQATLHQQIQAAKV